MSTLVIASFLALGMAVAAAGFAPQVVEALRTADYVYVATRRADGTWSKVVPVWFTYDGEAIYFTTAPGSYKARRIRKGSPMRVSVGTSDGPQFEARAELSSDPTLATRMGEAYNRKYWIAWLGLFRPRADRVQAGKTVIVKVYPPA